MENISVLGLGAMGSRMAKNLLKAGYQVTVWNRSANATEALAALGAEVASSPAEAVSTAHYVIAMVRDDEASRQVWLDTQNGALNHMPQHAIAIESSTLSTQWIKQLGQAAVAQGISLIEAPVSGSLLQAESRELIYLAGGKQETVAQAEPLLKTMGSRVNWVGPLGSGALAKLCTNTLLSVEVVALAELVGMLQRSGCEPRQVLEAVASTPVWNTYCTNALNSMLTENFSPQFPVSLVEKDLGYTIAAAGSAENAPTMTTVRQVFQNGIDKGLADLNLTSVVRLFNNPLA